MDRNNTNIVLKSCLYSSSPLFSLIKISSLSISSDSTYKRSYTISLKMNIENYICIFKYIYLTCLKLPQTLYSHWIISKNIPNVAFLNSGSGTKVISRNGPTIEGMKLILCSPAVGKNISSIKLSINKFKIFAIKCFCPASLLTKDWNKSLELDKRLAVSELLQYSKLNHEVYCLKKLIHVN